MRRVKGSTCVLLFQSDLHENYWADSMEYYTYLRNVQDLLFDWKTPYERRFGTPFKGPIIPFDSLFEYYPISSKDPCLDDNHFKEEELKFVGVLSKVCSQFVLKCLYLARTGRPDILWSVNKLARSITKWFKVCDKRLNRLISYIHHTCEYKQYCYVGNTAKQCRLELFQTPFLHET